MEKEQLEEQIKATEGHLEHLKKKLKGAKKPKNPEEDDV